MFIMLFYNAMYISILYTDFFLKKIHSRKQKALCIRAQQMLFVTLYSLHMKIELPVLKSLTNLKLMASMNYFLLMYDCMTTVCKYQFLIVWLSGLSVSQAHSELSGTFHFTIKMI